MSPGLPLAGMRVRAEFTTEPFHGEGEPPEHVVATATPLLDAGLVPDIGPLGTSVEGDAETVVSALTEAIREALAQGATRFTLQIDADLDAATGPPGSGARGGS